MRGPSPRHYDGRFTFARLKFPLCMGNCLYYYGLPPWQHGYPRAEDNMLQILDAITSIHPRVDDSVIVSVDDPEMFKYPVSYMTEASFWVLREPERQALNQYLLKGGFIIFDDFRNDYNRGSGGLPDLESNLERIIPGAHLLPMSPADPIFHSFFEIDSFDAISQDRRLRPAGDPRAGPAERSTVTVDGDRELQHGHFEFLGVLRHGREADRRVQSRVQARRQLHDLRPHALSPSSQGPFESPERSDRSSDRPRTRGQDSGLDPGGLWTPGRTLDPGPWTRD